MRQIVTALQYVKFTIRGGKSDMWLKKTCVANCKLTGKTEGLPLR